MRCGSGWTRWKCRTANVTGHVRGAGGDPVIQLLSAPGKTGPRFPPADVESTIQTADAFGAAIRFKNWCMVRLPRDVADDRTGIWRAGSAVATPDGEPGTFIGIVPRPVKPAGRAGGDVCPRAELLRLG